MGYRKQKLEAQIQKLIGTLIVTELKDPRIGFVTVTRVKMSKDYAYADVYISILGDEHDRQKTLEGLQSARGFVQYRVGKSLRIHTIPEVSFYVDTSIEEGVTMVNLLEKLQKESAKNDNGDSSSKS